MCTSIKKLKFNQNVLDIQNVEDVVLELQQFIKDQIFDKFKRRGAVIGISGGIDSALTCILCANAINPENIIGLIMPEKDSDPKSSIYAKTLCEKFNIKSVEVDVTPVLEALEYILQEIKLLKNIFLILITTRATE